MRPQTPTMFEYFRKETGVPASDCYVILGKGKLSILAYSNVAGYDSLYGASVAYGNNYIDDNATWNNIKYVLAAHHPRLSVVNLAQVDAIGHSGDSTGYVASIRQADSIVGLVWNLLQTDPFYKDSTTLFVVNDHGRHTDDFANHGDGCDGCRHLMCMMIGPDAKAGEVDSTYRQQIDLVPTIGELLEFPTPLVTGKALIPVHSAVPSLLLPENAAIVSVDTVTLTWSMPTSEVAKFQLEIATDSLMKDILLMDSSVAKKQLLYKIGKNKTSYWWRVRAYTQNGWANWSERKTFRAEIPVPDPAPEDRNYFFIRACGAEKLFNIYYALRRSSSVSITISDLQGRAITSLVEPNRQTGPHTTFVNVSALSRGCYVLVFKTDEFSKRKIVAVYY
jgi:hypothetical protein